MSGQKPTDRFARVLSGFLFAALLASSLFAIISPFIVGQSEPWRWEITRSENLREANFRGKIVSIDDRGITLLADGPRPTSLTSPVWPPSTQGLRTLRIAASLPSLPAGKSIDVPIRFFWQDHPTPEFHFIEQTLVLARDTRDCLIGLPPTATTIYRAGIQFPGLRDPVAIRSMDLPNLSAVERVRLAAAECTTPEPIANHTVNFLRGPSILAHSLNYFLVWGIVAALNAYAFVQVTRRRAISRRWIATIILIAWLFVDFHATSSLARQTWREFETFNGKTPTEQIAASLGDELAWAYEQLITRMPPGATFAVCSDDPFTPSHRLAYYLAPQRTRVEKPAAADYILIFHQSGATFDAAQSKLTLPGNENIPAEQIAFSSQEVYLLRRIAR